MDLKFKYVKKFCELCGTQLQLNNNRDIKRKRFCSKSCRSKYTMAIREKIKTIEKTCLTCGQKFLTHKSVDQKFCCRECFKCKELDYYLEKPDGYFIKYNRGRKRRIFLHVEKAELALGRKLKPGECVHHIDLIKTNNENSNLLICDRSYHRWLHDRYAKRFAELHLQGGD